MSQVSNWLQSASTFQWAVISVALLFIAWFVFFPQPNEVPSYSVGVIRPQPATGKPHPVERKDLLDVASTQPIVFNGLNGPQIGFPTSPIMPDLNVIDGVAPYNPGAMGSSWDNPEVPATGAPV